MASDTSQRGSWNSKLGFIMAAAGSAVGLGNIWRFPGEVADNGGAAFILIYLACCFIVGFPVMVSELAVGRKTGKNPVGAFKKLTNHKIFHGLGMWGVICGLMILSFYVVVAGWTLSYFFQELFFFLGNEHLVSLFSSLDNGYKNAFFSVIFMLATILILTGGVSDGIEKATKTMMPILVIVLLIMIVYVFTQEGSMDGLKLYLKPDFSKINMNLIFKAMGQAFFSLSLGMGALITYGSYLNKKQNIAESAAYVTLADVFIAFIAGLLIIPAMFVAQKNGVVIFNENGDLIASTQLVFNVLPALFHTMNATVGFIFGGTFFLLLSMAALTSTISLLEVPVSYAIDEHGLNRKRAAWTLGSIVLFIALFISFDISLIGTIDLIFSTIGLPLGGLLISIFVGYYWKTSAAFNELRDGYPSLDQSIFGKVWPILIKYISPILIGIVFFQTIQQLIFP